MCEGRMREKRRKREKEREIERIYIGKVERGKREERKRNGEEGERE